MRYDIRVKGAWTAEAGELLAHVEIRPEGASFILSADLDQAGLNGLIERTRVLGLELIEVRRARPSSQKSP